MGKDSEANSKPATMEEREKPMRGGDKIRFVNLDLKEDRL